MTRRQRQAKLGAVAAGLLATAAVLAAYGLGWLDWLELKTLDLRFCYANSIPQDPRIVCIDIDDSSLRVFGRWPWPRDRQAPLIAVPAELGAAAILVDLTWTERQTARSLEREDADLAVDPWEYARRHEPLIVFPDHALRAAIAQAGNVYLAYDYTLASLERCDEFNLAADALQGGQNRRVRELLERLARRRRRRGVSCAAPERATWPQRVGLVSALERRPGADEEALIAAGVAEAAVVRRFFERCRAAALRRLMRRWFDARPSRWEAEPVDVFAACYAEVVGERYRPEAALGKAFRLAFRQVLGEQATTRGAPLPVGPVRSVAVPVEGLTPVYFMHARAARRCGFVVFEPDADGVVRRMPLLARQGGRVLVQLALAVGYDVLGLSAEQVRAQGDRLVLRPRRAGSRPLVVQLDRSGRALVPWVGRRSWLKQFVHLGADDLCTLQERREDLAHNRRLLRAALRRILADARFAGLAEAVDVLDAIDGLELQLRAARYRGQWRRAQDVAEHLRSFERQVPQIERRVRARAARLRADARRAAGGSATQPESGPLAEQLALLDRCGRANEGLRREIDQHLRALRAKLAGKICLVGYTATALADMRPIPTSPSAPGLMAHANLLNGLLTGRLVGWAPPTINVALATVLGVGACVLSVWRPPRVALALVLLAVVAYVGLAGWLAFYRWAYWVALTPALGAMLASFVAIAVYRYFFVDSERRQLATALSQYTSRAIARQVAEDPELCRRAEMREVTAMFTDLKGFTTLSERIGAARTQHLLNTCLGCFTEVMLRREAMINKFIGDGVFAFWNPVIHPQADHALRACQTALELLVALRELIAQQRRQRGDEAFGDLVLRIGLATGSAIVGPCGSERKFDYTCIGDSVNVAARLESANKFYGTHILVNEQTRRRVGQRFAFRALGGVQAKGKRQAVQIAELLGRADEVDAPTRDYARTFGAAVARFQQRDWPAALRAFERCLTQRPDDAAAQHYAAAARSYARHPPGPGWSGALELAEK